MCSSSELPDTSFNSQQRGKTLVKPLHLQSHQKLYKTASSINKLGRAVEVVFTQNSPFKPSCPPFWLSHSRRPHSSSMASSNSRSLWASSDKALHRQEVYRLQGVNCLFHNVIVFSSLRQCKRSTNYNTMLFSESHRYDNMEYYSPSPFRKLVVRSESRSPSTSSAQILSHLLNKIPPEGKHFSTVLVQKQRIEKRNQQLPIHLHGSFILSTASELALSRNLTNWNLSTEEVKEMKRTTHCSSENNSQEIVTIPSKRASQNSFDHTNKGCKEINPQTPRRHKPSSQEQKCNVWSRTKGRKESNSRPFHTDAIQCNVGDTNSYIITEGKTAEESHHVPLPDLCKKLNRIYDKVIVVDNISIAKEVVGLLTNQYRHLVHACDTEVAQIDVKLETPVDHGEIICFSIYSGPEADFGGGKSCIWVDVLDGGGKDLLVEFAPFFEDPSIKKVWHNYSFDNHVIENYGLKLDGFHADTMHLARLWDSSRRINGGYSLEALTSDRNVMSSDKKCRDGELIGKVSMKTIFGRRKVKKDGTEGKIIAVAPVKELQRVERRSWICYSAMDSMSTLKLYESLKSKLLSMSWKLEGENKGCMFAFYEKYWRPFGELLVKMETEGMLVDRTRLAEMEKVAKAEQQVAATRFRNWAARYCPDARYMNVGSDTQLRQLFFGGITNRYDPTESLPVVKDFKVPNVDKVIEEGKKIPKKYRTIKLHKIVDDMKTEMYTASGWPSCSGDALKALAGKVSAEFDFMEGAHQLQSDNIVENLHEKTSDRYSWTTGVDGSEDTDISAYGTAYGAFGRGKTGRESCYAIAALCQVCSIDSLISNFILPLQGSHISGKNGRIHCSLNINTETGRLSARRPNLQNQPALEKDRYKIRQAFIAAPGNSLIVADYGQLELRILAHLANCKSMLDAFKAGGDFHSRTAMNMYPHICEAVEQKQVLLEWHPQPGEDKPPVPLLKDAFASERRKAKMLNFSIAYGKTPMGLARDWKVSVKEAKETVDLWYRERGEVLRWQEKHKEEARKYNRVHTLLGRARTFPLMTHASPSQKGHIERAAINAPVQGSAADVAMCAMLEISKNAHLKELGWKLLLQVHDEVILEGPTESAELAKAIVVECMSNPFDGKNILKVDLSVDAKCAKDWYSAK
ncbi:DNA polymerase I B, chloroplastic/mitochondrial-like isoform X2 [Cornus florida]|uniref:DNA polymerase I B, chloroplastic/mitochondrial-like isoform X2 n=1 Tax=Cornus florida TaxID=4283 RepID=UPI00289738C0|nr:DNA polymerase I B, chloroplastic/mitochondrial-like isoform X2 [Cornus florida]